MLGLLAAAVGVFLSHQSGNPSFDGIASIIIGLILAVVALLLIYESKGLLVGEGMDAGELEKLRLLAKSMQGIETVDRVVTMHFGPETVLLAIAVKLRPDLSLEQAESVVEDLQRKIRQRRTEIKHIFIALAPNERGTQQSR